MTSSRAKILGQPVNDVGSQPADAAAMKATFVWKAAEQGKTQHHPAGSACQACDIMRGEELLPVREALVDVRRETNAVRRSW